MRPAFRERRSATDISTTDKKKEHPMTYRATCAACLVIALAAASPAQARGGGHGHVAGLHGGGIARGGATHFAGRGFRGGYVRGYGGSYRGYGYGYGHDGYAFAPDIIGGLLGGNLAYACGDTPYSSCYYGY